MKILTTLGFATVALTAGLMWSQVQAGDEKKQAKETKADASKLVGTYAVTAEEKNGQTASAEHLKGVTVRIATNAITTFDKDKKEVYVATYDLDTSRKPWRITLTATVAPGKGVGAKSEGLIEANGDTVKLIYALPGGKAPTEFKTGEKQLMFVLKKASK